MSKEPQPVLKSMEQVLKDVYEKHRTVVNPDGNWATWETCVEDGTVNVCYEAMSDWANQCTTGLSARLDWQINQSFKQSEEISTLQKTIEEQKKEILDWQRIAKDALSGDENMVLNAWVKHNLGDTLKKLQALRAVLLQCEGKPGVNTLGEIIDKIDSTFYNPPKI